LFSILLAGGLGVIIQYVLRRFLPELGAKAEGQSAPGVDIVIDDGLPLGEPGPASRLGEELPPLAAEETEHVLAPLTEAALEPALAALEQEAPLEEETLAEAVPEEEPGLLETLPGSEEAMFSEGSLESLPDIGGLGSSPGAGGTGRFRSELADAQLDSLIKGQDPASLAKAVRTFLRKDQEG
jgi:hypothetical protein